MFYILRGHLPSEVDRMTLADYGVVKACVDVRLDEIQRSRRGGDLG